MSGDGATISFESPETLTLAPGETAEVTVVGDPPARYAVSFLLVGTALDASLDATSVIADDTGRASVRLRAPNQATYFALRATIQDGPSASLNVAVSDQGFGDLLVVPDYQGVRGTREWVASVVAGSTCEALSDTFPDDPPGPDPVGAKPGDSLIIEDVPVGPNLAVFMRGGHYMWGCADKADLVANQSSEVTVTIVDKPLDLSEADLDVELGLELDPQEWAALVTVERQRLLDAFTGGASESSMLLAAMEQVWSGDPQEFDDASATNGWPAEVASHFASNSIDLTQSISDLLAQGLATEPSLIRATLTAVEGADDHALLTLVEMGTSTPAIMQVPSDYVVSFTSDPNDTSRVGGSLFWMPSRYLGQVTSGAGLAAHDQANDFGDVLGELAECTSLDLQGMSCSGSCIAQLCRDALAARWELALGASAASLVWGELPFEASGASRFDDDARITGFTGTWLGDLTAGLLAAEVSGEAQAYGEGDRPR